MSSSGKVTRLALVIGSQCDAMGSLSFLPDLAIELYQMLVDPTRGACASALPSPAENGLVLNPNRQEALDALRSAFDYANQLCADTLIVAVLGHGFADTDDFYFLTSDSPAAADPDTAIHLADWIKRLLARANDLGGLIVWLDTCQSGVAIQQARTQWGSVGLTPARQFEILSATDDNPAYSGDFTRALLGVVASGVQSAGSTLDANDVRVSLQEGASRQRPQRLTVDGGGWEQGAGLWLARNLSASPRSYYETQGRSNFLDRALSASRNRILQRRQSAGLSDMEVTRSLTLPLSAPVDLLETPTGGFRVLVGSLGSGKSDTAEAWFQQSVSAARASQDSPLPVWITMSGIGTGNRIEDRVLEAVGTQQLHDTGVDLVVDGVDERSDRETAILMQVQEFLAHWPRARVIVTARTAHGVEESAIVRIESLTSSESLLLIAEVANVRSPAFATEWPPTLLEAVQRPLFALLAAHHLGSITGSTGPAELIDLVVDDVLACYPELRADGYRAIAVATIRNGGPVDPREFLSASQVTVLRDSPLLISARHEVAFTLATFEQWFAAQALIGGEIEISEVVSTMTSFSRWRYVLAIVLAAGPPGRVDPIMGTIARWNPGGAASVVDTALQTRLNRAQPAIEPADSRLAAERVRFAASAWLSGFGPIAKAARLVRSTWDGPGDPLSGVTVAVQVSGRQLGITWAESASPLAGQLPPVVDKVPHGSHSYESRYRPMPTAKNWVWAETRADLAQMLTPGMVDQIFRAAPPDSTAKKEWLAAIRVESTRQKADFKDPAAAADMWPAPDLPPTHRRPWGGYSTDRAYERACAVLRAAMDVYCELAHSALPGFGDTLFRHALMPATLQGTMIYSPPPSTGFGALNDEPGFTYYFSPTGTSRAEGRTGDNRISLTLNPPRSRAEPLPHDDERITQAFNRYTDANPQIAQFIRLCFWGGRIDIFDPQAATALAMRWLWDDLRELGWVTDQTPNLDPMKPDAALAALQSLQQFASLIQEPPAQAD